MQGHADFFDREELVVVALLLDEEPQSFCERCCSHHHLFRTRELVFQLYLELPLLLKCPLVHDVLHHIAAGTAQLLQEDSDKLVGVVLIERPGLETRTGGEKVDDIIVHLLETGQRTMARLLLLLLSFGVNLHLLTHKVRVDLRTVVVVAGVVLHHLDEGHRHDCGVAGEFFALQLHVWLLKRVVAFECGLNHIGQQSIKLLVIDSSVDESVPSEPGKLLGRVVFVEKFEGVEVVTEMIGVAGFVNIIRRLSSADERVHLLLEDDYDTSRQILRKIFREFSAVCAFCCFRFGHVAACWWLVAGGRG